MSSGGDERDLFVPEPDDAPDAPGAGRAEADEPAPKPSLLARAKAERERLSARAEETRSKLEARRPHSKVIETVFSSIEHDTATGGAVLSGAVAFRVFLFQVPYVFFFVVGLGFAADAGNQDPQDLARAAGIGGLTANAVAGAATDLSTFGRITALVVGGLALFIGARTAVKVLRVVHGLVWRVPVPKLRHSSRAALGFIGVVTVGLLLAAGVGWLRSQSFVGGLVGTILFVVVPTGTWLLVSWWMPRKECPWWALLPGAVLFGVGVELLHVFTVYWIAHSVTSKSETYGAIGSALALLLWAYLLGRLIIAAAVVNASRWRVYEGGAAPESEAPPPLG